jgi:hypothetical protein
VLVDEAVEAGAARPAVEPEHDGVGGGVALREHEVVEEAPLAGPVHRHVPGVVPGGEAAAGAAMEAREARDEVLLRRRGGEPEDERGGYKEVLSIA